MQAHLPVQQLPCLVAGELLGDMLLQDFGTCRQV